MSNIFRNLAVFAISAIIALGLPACGSGGSIPLYTIGGAVAGLDNGQQVTLQNNGGDPLILTANGAFSFATPVTYNGSYAVSVGTQPTGQTCTVSNGSGAGVTGNVSNVSVVCSSMTYTIGGTVTGLASGQQVTLQNNSGNSLTVTANGTFNFATPVAYNGSYAVSVGTQPTGQTCTVTNGTGAVSVNVTTVAVNCVAKAYALVASQGSNNVSVYNINATTGALTPVTGSPFVTGTSPYVTVNPAGTLAFVANFVSNDVSVYNINATTGALTPVTGSPFASGTAPTSVAVVQP